MYMYLHMYMYMYMYMYMCKYVYIYTYIYIYEVHLHIAGPKKDPKPIPVSDQPDQPISIVRPGRFSASINSSSFSACFASNNWKGEVHLGH